jgi:hypothetical protein
VAGVLGRVFCALTAAAAQFNRRWIEAGHKRSNGLHAARAS